MPDTRWFTSHQSLCELADWMNENGLFSNIDDVLHFFNKPWNYEDQWAAYIAERDAVELTDREVRQAAAESALDIALRTF